MLRGLQFSLFFKVYEIVYSSAICTFHAKRFYIKSATVTKAWKLTVSGYLRKVSKYSHFTFQRIRKIFTMLLWFLISVSTLFFGKILMKIYIFFIKIFFSKSY